MSTNHRITIIAKDNIINIIYKIKLDIIYIIIKLSCQKEQDG